MEGRAEWLQVDFSCTVCEVLILYVITINDKTHSELAHCNQICWALWLDVSHWNAPWELDILEHTCSVSLFMQSMQKRIRTSRAPHSGRISVVTPRLQLTRFSPLSPARLAEQIHFSLNQSRCLHSLHNHWHFTHTLHSTVSRSVSLTVHLSVSTVNDAKFTAALWTLTYSCRCSCCAARALPSLHRQCRWGVTASPAAARLKVFVLKMVWRNGSVSCYFKFHEMKVTLAMLIGYRCLPIWFSLLAC